MKVEIGDKAKCKVTGIEGIVTVRHDYLYGMARIGIQPQGSHNGKPHEDIHLDVAQAELIEKNVIDRSGLGEMKNTVSLGDKCKDKISGFNGVCTGVAEWLYSCKKTMITPRAIDKKTQKPVESCWFDAPQIEKIEEHVKEFKRDDSSTGGFGKSISSSGRSVAR